jgi:hypothetical protein
MLQIFLKNKNVSKNTKLDTKGKRKAIPLQALRVPGG